MIKRFSVLLIVAVLLTVSCSKEKNTALTRAFHNTTSHYNGYFNAREIIKEQERIVKAGYKEDYSQILPIFIYPDEATSQSMYPEMDKVIEKCSEVIERHSIYKKKKENVKWIDDAYFLIGKARFYKQESSLAEQTFLWVFQSYKKDPQRYRGLNWLIKSFIETEQWDRAEEFIDLAEEQLRKYPEELKGHFYAIYADYHFKKDRDYDKTIENLELAAALTKKKEDRRRYIFVLAQLYQKKNNLQLATERYSKVLKLNPDYTMRFNARISRAIAFDATGGDSESIKKELNKMLKDIKNEEFRDQIYYALAELELKEDNEPLAIEYLKKSAKFSVSNKRQKGLSYLKLADIYFEQPHYINAQAYYDSTIQNLPKEHPEYFPTEDKNNSLQNLVANLKTIQLQDSLLMLSNLSEKEREKKVKEIIKEIQEEEERREQAELAKIQERQNAAGLSANNFGSINGRGKTYFYNPNTIALGAADFNQVWGTRKNEDNWRRSKKLSGSLIAQNQQSQNPTQDAAQKEEEESEKYDPEFYLKNIPKDINEQLEAHGKIAEALFNVGTIFKESFIDYQSAIESFERVTKEYDTSKFNLPSHYQLYRIYKINQEEEKAQIEKDWVLDNYPFSEYAYLIKNPNYNKESKETKEKVEEFYIATYKLYQYNLYSDVITSCEKADETFQNNHLKAKFDFLKAKSIGNIKSKEEFKLALEAVVKDHPEDPVKKSAEEILRFLNKKGGAADNKPKVQYKYNEEDKHIFIVSAQVTKTSNFQQLKNNLADFNRDFFREKKLKVTQSALNKNSLYLVRTFNDQESAIRYIKAFRNNSALMLQLKSIQAKNYLISNTNFRTLFQSKDESLYLNFFNEEYPL